MNPLRLFIWIVVLFAMIPAQGGVFCNWVLDRSPVFKSEVEFSRYAYSKVFNRSFSQRLMSKRIPLPTTVSDKAGFMSALIDFQIRELEPGHPLVALSQHSENLIKDAREWDSKKGLSLEQIRRFVTDYLMPEQAHLLSPSTWRSVLVPNDVSPIALTERVWTTEILSQKIYLFLKDSIFEMRLEDASFEDRFLRLFRIPLRVAKEMVHSASFEKSPHTKSVLNLYFEDRSTSEHAFSFFSNRTQTEAVLGFYSQWLLKIARFVLAATFWWATGAEIDQHIFPIEGLWVSREQAIIQLRDIADREYKLRFQADRSASTKQIALENTRLRYEHASLRTLLYRIRQQNEHLSKMVTSPEFNRTIR